jgi:hypothetical protein
MRLLFYRTFEVGLLDPATITWNDFQQAVIGDGSSSPPAPKPTKKGGKQGKADKGGPAGVDAIADFRGWAERIRKNQKDIPPEIKGIEREDRAKCRVVLRGLFGTFSTARLYVKCSYIMHSRQVE